MDPARNETRNAILATILSADFEILRAKLSLVDLPVRKLIEGRNRKIEAVYFLEDGLASVMASAGSHHSIEVGLIGREGMTGLPLLLGVDRSLHETFMQSAGRGWRLGAEDLAAAMQASATLRRHLLHYAHTMVTQIAFTALANARYKIAERLARWLLMAHDRCDGDQVFLTHEFLATMLGSRRPGITLAMNALEKSGFIESRRGSVVLRDRVGLEDAANGSYGMLEAETIRLFG